MDAKTTGKDQNEEEYEEVEDVMHLESHIESPRTYQKGKIDNSQKQTVNVI